MSWRSGKEVAIDATVKVKTKRSCAVTKTTINKERLDGN
jgi:hypothetical protein